MNQCVLCQKVINFKLSLKQVLWLGPIEEPLVCQTCWQTFKKIGPSICPGCGNSQNDTSICLDCQKWQKRYGYLVNNRALFEYNDAFSDYMQKYKFQGDYQLRVVFQDIFNQFVTSIGADIIIPIPITHHTMDTRGFNQVIGFLKTNFYDETVLKHKSESKETQSLKTRRERLNMIQPFEIVSGNCDKLTNQHVLLVDDVYTTGRTLYHAAQLVKRYQPQSVTSVTLAR